MLFRVSCHTIKSKRLEIVTFSVLFTNKKIRVWRKSRAPFWQAGYGEGAWP